MSTATKVFLALAALPYPFVLWMTWHIRGEPDGLLGGFAELAMAAVMLSLSIALTLTGIHNGIPWWSYVVAPLAIILYLAGVVSVAELLRTDKVQWMIVVPAVGPLVMAAYIVWVSMAGDRGSLFRNLVAAGVWIALFSLSAVPMRKSQEAAERRQKQIAEAQALVQAHVNQFNQVPANAPLRDFGPFLEWDETRSLALAKMHASARKDSDILAMMQSGDYSMVAWLSTLEIPVTPELCQCGRKMLRHLTAQAKERAAKAGYIDISSVSESSISAITYLAENKCPIFDELTEFTAVLRASPDPKGVWTYALLDRLRLGLSGAGKP